MNSSLSEQLTINFYEWEQRGRGWLLWDYPVEIEPPFEPFSYSLERLTNSVQDDGRKPTFLSNLADKFVSAFTQQSQTEISGGESSTETSVVTPRIFNDLSKIFEIIISVPGNSKVSIDQFTQILTLLSSTRFPLSFEIFATENTIIPQIACREYDFPYVQQIL
jgi:hypothetical protein